MSKSWLRRFTTPACRWLFSLLLILCLVGSLPGGPTRDDDIWPHDRIVLKSGKVLHGVIDWEDETTIHFRHVIQKRGFPTTVFRTEIAKNEIKADGIVPLTDANERRLLRARIDSLDRAAVKEKIEKLVLEPAPWGNDPDRKSVV